MLTKLKRLPNLLKLPLQYAASVVPNELLQSREYKAYAKRLRESEHWDAKQIEQFQNLQFRAMVKHCYENVPYYKDLFNNHGIGISELKDLRDLKRIPLLTKQTVMEHTDQFIAANVSRSALRPMVTGGTTSAPLRFYNTDATNQREEAFFDRIWRKYHYTGQKCLYLRSQFDYSDELYRYNPYRNLIYINTRNFDNRKMEAVIRLMKLQRPQFIQAYPSLIYLLAKYINDEGLSAEIVPIQGIFCSSEKMFDFQRNEIEQAFQCEVVDYYGHNERLVLMERCNRCKVYHVIPEYGIAELLDAEGNEVREDNAVAEIVGTGFNNEAFPLLRYRTGDMATTLPEDYCCSCGKPYRSVREIDGRSGDFIVTSDGKLYSPTVLEFGMDNVSGFKDIQLIQRDMESLDVCIVPDASYREEEGERFKRELLQRIDSPLRIEVKLVDRIERPANQKRRFVISHVHGK